jgi:hypothetical protein
MVEALNAGDITKVGVGVIIALIVLGFLVGMLITKLIGKVLVAVVVVVLGVIVWQQRTSIEHKIDQKKCNLTFVGIHLDPPDSLKRFCS